MKTKTNVSRLTIIILILASLAGSLSACSSLPEEQVIETEQPAMDENQPVEAESEEASEMEVEREIITPENAGLIEELEQLSVEDTLVTIAWSPDGRYLAVGGERGIYIYASHDLEAVQFIEVPSPLSSLAISPDGKTLASGGIDGNIHLWDISNGTLLDRLEGHTLTVYGLAFSPDGKTLASGGMSSAIGLWEVSTGTLLNVLEGHSSAVFSLEFSPDGMKLASGSSGGILGLWDVADGTLLEALGGREGPVYSVAFSPDGTIVASGLKNFSIMIWDVMTGDFLYGMQGQTDQNPSTALSKCIDFSPDGLILVSEEDQSINLWALSSDGLEIISSLEGFTSPIVAVAFSPDGSILASGSYDGTVRLWGVP